MGSVYSHYRKKVGGKIINTTLASSIGLKGLFFYNARLIWEATQGRN